jgi:hypothetical protein
MLILPSHAWAFQVACLHDVPTNFLFTYATLDLHLIHFKIPPKEYLKNGEIFEKLKVAPVLKKFPSVWYQTVH